VLRDVRQRLLDDAVERRLHLARQPFVPELDLEMYRDRCMLAVGVHEAFECGRQAEVVESGRPELDRQSPDILKRGHDELAQGGDTGPRLVRVDRLLE
jgi:hypothetical protein